MSDSDSVKWLLLDSDLSTRIGGDLPVLSSNLYLEANEPGSGEVRLPLDSTAASLIEAGMFVQCEYRGAVRGGFFVEAIKEVDADSSENSGRVMSISGRSALALLDKDIIYDDSTSETTRTFDGMTKAEILIQLIDEAQARGGLANLTYDFTIDDDSDANAWTDDESYSLTVGMKLLDVARQFCKTGGFDFDINLVAGEFVLSAYANGIGSDLTNTIYFRIGANCQEVNRDERAGSELINEYLVKYKGGYFSVSDAASIAANGRSADILNIEQAQTSASATTYAAAKLALNKDPKENKSVKVWDGIAPNIFLDYNLGDTISLDRFGVVTEDRILGLQLDFSGETFASVIVDFNHIFYDSDLQMSRDLDHLMSQWNTAHDAGLIEVSFWANLKAKNYINGMLLYDGEIYVIGAGDINDFSGVEKYNLTTGLWSKVGQAGLNFNALAICEMDGDIYITDDEGADSVIYRLIGSTWTQIGRIRDANTQPFAGVRTMVGYNGVLYVGGGELILEVDSSVNIYHHVAAWDRDTDTWTSIAGAHDAQVDVCNTLVILNGELYGGFDGVGTLTNEGFKKSGGWFWAAVDITNMDGKSVEALAVYGSGLVVACETKICIWDGTSTSWTEIGTISGGTARGKCFAVYLTDIYLGGDFTAMNGASGYNYIAKYSGGSWKRLGNIGATGLGGPVSSLIFTNNDLYIGGNFFTAGGKPAIYMAVYYTNFQHALDHIETSGNTFDMAAAIHNAEASAITDADEMGFWEDVSQGLRKITWSTIKSTLQTFFNAIFQPLDSDLTAIAALTPANDDIIQRKAGVWTNRALGQLITDLTERIQDVVGAMLQDGDHLGVSASYDDAAGVIDIVTDDGYIGGLIRDLAREKLSGAQTYYVRTDGADSNPGLADTAGGAFLTIQKAIDVASALDNGGFDITIQVRDGTYTGAVVIGSFVGRGGIIIQGNSGTPANVVISTTSAACFTISGVLSGTVTIKDMKLQTTTGGSGIAHTASGLVNFTNIEFGAIVAYQVYSGGPASFMVATGNYAISGGGLAHCVAEAGGQFNAIFRTVTITNTPAFYVVAYAVRGGGMRLVGNTYTGSATGKRYEVDTDSFIDVGAVPAENYLPGSTLGTMLRGGNYGSPPVPSRTSAQFDKANTTLANITGLTATLLAGRTYKFRAVLHTTSNVASGVKFAIAGTCTATAIIYEALVFNAAAIAAQTRATALATAVGGVTAVTVAYCVIEGVITVNAAGTLTVQFADNAGTNTSSVLIGSTFEVTDITP